MLALGAVACGDDAPPRSFEAAVSVHAEGCSIVPSRGAGLVVDRGRILTAAHVVAGATSIEVLRGGDTYTATVVAFDPVADVAVLSAPVVAGAFPVGSTASGATGTAVVRRDGEVVELPVRVIRPVTIRTADVFESGEVERPGFEIEADIEPGDSGAVVVVDGTAVAVIWARSRLTGGRAWAIDAAATWPGLLEQTEQVGRAEELGAGRCP